MASTHDAFQQDGVAARSILNFMGLAFYTVRHVCILFCSQMDRLHIYGMRSRNTDRRSSRFHNPLAKRL